MSASFPNPGKKKVLVILGAGSSIECGMPSVHDIDGKMKEWSSQWTVDVTFPRGIGRGTFNDLWETTEAFHIDSPQPQRINFEKILGEMITLAMWVTPSPFGSALQMAVKDGSLSQKFTLPSMSVKSYAYRHLIIDQMSFLLDKLAAYMRERSRQLDINSPKFLQYKNIISRLLEHFDLGIYNLNYDDVVYRAWPSAFTDFVDGRFDARGVGLQRKCEFIYHIHGSVHYSFSADIGTRVPEWQGNLEGSFRTRTYIPPEIGSDAKPIPLTTLVAGGHKLDQILADPSQTFHASLVRHAHEADAVLIIGHGFADIHVNRALQNRFHLSWRNVNSPAKASQNLTLR